MGPVGIEFVRNHQDLSTDKGYQFKFFCDRCGNGWMSDFQVSALGVGSSLLRAAGHVFGGIFGHAAQGGYEVRRAVQGKAHDDALRKAVDVARQRFKKCTRCGRWVCPETCWNASKGLCEECAPDLMEEAASAQANAAKEQVIQKARARDYVADVNVDENIQMRCPACNAQTQGGKFCPECGGALSAKTTCPACRKEIKAGAKFCPECGQKTGP